MLCSFCFLLLLLVVVLMFFDEKWEKYLKGLLEALLLSDCDLCRFDVGFRDHESFDKLFSLCISLLTLSIVLL